MGLRCCKTHGLRFATVRYFCGLDLDGNLASRRLSSLRGELCYAVVLWPLTMQSASPVCSFLRDVGSYGCPVVKKKPVTCVLEPGFAARVPSVVVEYHLPLQQY